MNFEFYNEFFLFVTFNIIQLCGYFTAKTKYACINRLHERALGVVHIDMTALQRYTNEIYKMNDCDI